MSEYSAALPSYQCPILDIEGFGHRDIPMQFRWRIPAVIRSSSRLPWTGDTETDFAIAGIVGELMGVAGTDAHVSVSLSEAWYKNKARIVGRGYTYTAIRGALDILRDSGWLYMLKGERREGGSGKQTTFWPTEAFIAHFGEERGIVYGLRDVIMMRDKNGEMIPVPATRDIDRQRRRIERINEAARGIDLTLEAPDVVWTPGVPMRIDGRLYDPRKDQFHAVYNASTQAGGRLYGPNYQTLANREHGRRAQLRIDGCPVDEPDFSGCHPRMLYHLRGLAFDGDLYDVAHPAYGRNEAKLGTQILINASGERKAMLAFCYRMAAGEAKAHYKATGARMATEEVDRIAKGHMAGAKLLFNALKAKHAPIGDDLFTGVGVRLQFIETTIMTAAAMACLDKGVVTLPMHDSSITKAGRDAGLMREAMQASYTAKVGMAPVIGGH